MSASAKNFEGGKEDRPPRILIIDDNPSIHRDFDLILQEKTGNSALDADDHRVFGAPAATRYRKPVYALQHASSGFEAVEKVSHEKAAARRFQVAFVDIRMPRLDGIDTIELIWRIDPHIQVVICTAHSDYSQKDLRRRFGRTDKLLLLKKPFDSIEVMQLARTLSEKWYLGQQAALKLAQLEELVARRTNALLQLQRAPAPDMPRPPGAALALVIAAGFAACANLQRLLGAPQKTLMAADEASGLELARQAVPDIIILDQTLARAAALKLCRSLKADVITSHVPIMVVSSAAADGFQLEALEAGADDFAGDGSDLPMRLARLVAPPTSFRAALETSEKLFPRELAATQPDALFLQRAITAIEENLADSRFDVEALARHVGVSRRQLFRKIKALNRTSPRALIRTVRLNRAAKLLTQSDMTFTEVTFAVGFQDVDHFRALFKEEHGILPSEFHRTHLRAR
ncbi:MAG TPA: response regulator [Verrucomicrobiae bacterium]|jgi:CheY-like chemotaxis protein|nr:response regulator [Verrucomicrobiae bacterium]